MPVVRRSVDEIGFDEVRRQLKIPVKFPAEVEEEARAAISDVVLPDHDATATPFVTLDPPGSMDLDQALHIQTTDGGWVVSYAIADVAAFVRPGGLIDQECWRRGATVYSPDLRTPLHPTELSEGGASLLPGQVRPAVLWEIALDADGAVVHHSVRRARVRSVAQLDYPSVQKDFDSGLAHPSLAALGEVGIRRIALGVARQAIELDLPDQDVFRADDGSWTVRMREQLPCERWNAQISLLTGMVAGSMMLEAKVGILRTLPPPPASAVKLLRRTAELLGVSWPDGASPAKVIDSVDRVDPKDVAFLEQAAHLLRGAGYAPFEGEVPEQPAHAGVGAVYAHATAPLRRLVDRYVSEVCLSIGSGVPVPKWVRAALPGLPQVMSGASARDSRVEHAVVDTVEAILLAKRMDETFPAVVIDSGKDAATVVLDDPAVRAKCDGVGMGLGDRVQVKVLVADPDQHLVKFALA